MAGVFVRPSRTANRQPRPSGNMRPKTDTPNRGRMFRLSVELLISPPISPTIELVIFLIVINCPPVPALPAAGRSRRPFVKVRGNRRTVPAAAPGHARHVQSCGPKLAGTTATSTPAGKPERAAGIGEEHRSSLYTCGEGRPPDETCHRVPQLCRGLAFHAPAAQAAVACQRPGGLRRRVRARALTQNGLLRREAEKRFRGDGCDRN
jgi:hypothetical protein